jgi:Cytochrome C'
MKTRPILKSVLLSLSGVFLFALSGHSQNAGGKIVPKLEPIAETKLIMEGLLHSNFRGLERTLNQKAPDAQGWTFARGQALLIAEGANLLMLRPPKNQGEQAWFERAMELRTFATQLAQVAARKDLDRGRTSLQTLANSCNRCHQTFRVQVQITPFETEPPLPKAEE